MTLPSASLRSFSQASPSTAGIAAGEDDSTGSSHFSFQKRRHSAWQPAWALPSQRRSASRTLSWSLRLPVCAMVSQILSARLSTTKRRPR